MRSERASADSRPEMRPVRERCYPVSSIPCIRDDYACPFASRFHESATRTLHPVASRPARRSQACGRVRTPGSAPSGKRKTTE
jgi:hypothetical protein